MALLTPGDANRLDDYRFQMGHDAGNLALALDYLTDMLQLVGKLTVYRRAEGKGSNSAQPPPDLAELHQLLLATKELVQESLLRLKNAE